MCITAIPHFKEVILMAFTCEACGWKDVEVKGGGAVPAKGTLIELYYNPQAEGAMERDMTRDVIKGDMASIEIPELDLLVTQGSLGGMYTTVEGLLTAMRDKLVESNPFTTEEATDSASSERKAAFLAFKARFDAVVDGAAPFTLRLRDPMANTWIYSPFQFMDPPRDDPHLTQLEYERSHQEELDLGLLDMKTEGYGEHASAEGGEGEVDSAPSGSAASASGGEGGAEGPVAPPAATDAAVASAATTTTPAAASGAKE